MAEECGNARVKLPRAVALAIPVGGIAGLFFVRSALFFLLLSLYDSN